MEKNRKKYVCIFPGLHNYHLNKDVGMVPYTMSRYYNFRSEIVTYKQDQYTVYEDYLKNKNFSLIFLPENSENERVDLIHYLAKNSGDIDVLQYFHLRYLNIFLYSLTFKLFNRKGKFYLKLDANDPIISFLVDRKGLKASLRRGLMSLTFKYLVDLVSIETKHNYEKLEKSSVIPTDKLLFLPNGIQIFSEPPEVEKKNQILTVGHLGSEAKGTEILLQAFALIPDLGDWELVLVGDVDERFEDYISHYFDRYPHLRDRIKFKGYISDREELYQYYAESRIFCFPSRTESFGISLIEAAYFRNYIISTRVGAGPDLLDIYQYGELIEIDDSEGLAGALHRQILKNDGKDPDPQNSDIIKQVYDWRILCKKIVFHLH